MKNFLNLRLSAILLAVCLLAFALPALAADSVPNLQLGLANQPVADVQIQESSPGVFQSNPDTTTVSPNGTVTTSGTTQGALILELPAGVSFTATPTVKVTAGDLQISPDSVTTGTNDDRTAYCQFNIKSASTVPSTITVSNIRLTLDRTVPLGPVYLKVEGSAANETGNLFPDHTVLLKLPLGNVVSASQTTSSATFQVGSGIYTLNGLAQTMDAAPYIKSGRVYIPLRYLANLLGVTDQNITFDNNKIILTRGSLKLELALGSNQLLVNGSPTTMDAAPEIVDNRTMLPARSVAEALGAQVGFADNQVIINLGH